jgi:hypothetical protein
MGNAADTKLIVIDGIMGSGKSSISSLVTGQLRRNGRPAHRYGNRSQGLRAAPDELRRVLWELPDRAGVWGIVGPAELAERSMAAWQRFAAEAALADEVCVFDGRLFNGDFAGLMMMDIGEERLAGWVSGVASLAAPLCPRIVYLNTPCVDRALRRTAALRGSRWVESQVRWKTRSPYCTARGLTGVEGWIALYVAYQDVSRRLLRASGLPFLEVDVSALSWWSTHRSILDFLGISPALGLEYHLVLARQRARGWLNRLLRSHH